MAEVYFLGDCHFGHRNILEYRPRFKTIKEHDDFIIKNINGVVTKRDKLILTGDICFGVEALDLLRRINCPNIHLVLGNHDDYNIDFKKEVPNIKWVSGDFKYKEFWVSHIPLHPDHIRGRANIHAHLHEAKIKGNKKKFYHTSCEQINYTPVSLQQIRKSLGIKQPSTPDWGMETLVDKVKGVLGVKRKTGTEIPRPIKHGKTSVKKRGSKSL